MQSIVGRGKKGTEHHGAVNGDGIPVACMATAADVNDTVLFERLFLAAFAVMARISTVLADKGHDAEGNRAPCRSFGAEPRIHKRRQPSGSGLGRQRWPVERSNAWLLENKRLALRCDRCSSIVQPLPPGLTHEIAPVEQSRLKSALRLLKDPRRLPQTNAFRLNSCQ